MGAPKLSVVVPCFNEEDIFDKTCQRLTQLLLDMVTQGLISESSFVCFIDDGSSDRTWELIQSAINSSKFVRGIKLSRNFGHQNALLAGLLRVADCCDCSISIDADLQQDESAMTVFLQEYAKGVDIVLGVRNDRGTDSTIKRATAEYFYKLMSVMGVSIVRNHADYRLMSQRALKALAMFGEENIFLRGMIHQVGFKKSIVYFDVREREAGESKYTFRKMVKFALNGITSFSIAPLRIISAIGGVMTVFSALMLGYVVIQKYMNAEVVPGWASIVLPIYILGGIQMFSLGIIGEYVGRIYLESKRRPRYIIEEDRLV